MIGWFKWNNSEKLTGVDKTFMIFIVIYNFDNCQYSCNICQHSFDNCQHNWVFMKTAYVLVVRTILIIVSTVMSPANTGKFT